MAFSLTCSFTFKSVRFLLPSCDSSPRSVQLTCVSKDGGGGGTPTSFVEKVGEGGRGGPPPCDILLHDQVTFTASDVWQQYVKPWESPAQPSNSSSRGPTANDNGSSDFVDEGRVVRCLLCLWCFLCLFVVVVVVVVLVLVLVVVVVGGGGGGVGVGVGVVVVVVVVVVLVVVVVVVRVVAQKLCGCGSFAGCLLRIFL